MLAHKLRLVLTTASIALGVAFLAGTLLLTDTLRVAFDQLFGSVSSGTDAVVRQEAAYSASAGVGLRHEPLPADVLDRVRAVDGVAVAEGAVSGYALIVDPGGRAVLTEGGAPTMGYSLPVDEALRGDVHLRSGRAPQGPDEVALDASSAEKGRIALGASVGVLFRGPARTFTVVGTVGYGDEKDLGGTTAAYFDPAAAPQLLGSAGTFDQIQVRAATGVSDAALAARLASALPDGLEAVTGAQVATESADAIHEQFGFLTVLLAAFAGIALFVGSFIIWNTFTMIVTQRSREIALLRAIGATRGQVLRSLVLESALLGLVASAVGVVLGVGVARGLTALMDAVGLSLPTTSLQVLPRTVWLSLLVGTGVTVLAALVPARRATAVLPIEALRDATPGTYHASRVRAALGSVLAAGGVAAILLGLYGEAGGTAVLLGVPATLFGVITLAPLVARPLAFALGAPLARTGIPGELARQNAMRNPRRTAATATALMIGLTLVVGMGVFASSLKASFGPILGESTRADLFVSPASSQGEGFSPEVTRIVADVPGVDVVAASSYGQLRVDGGDTSYASVDPATVEQAMVLDLTEGTARGLGTDGVLVSTAAAAQHGWSVGDPVHAEFAASGARDLTVRGIFANKGFLGSDYAISLATQDQSDGGGLHASALVVLDRGADAGATKARIAQALTGHPDAKVLDQREKEQEVGGIVDQLLTFVLAMLLLAVVIALLGIVNTLALSVFERTRELGLLRAVGMTRSQVRAMVRRESLILSLIGAGLGAALGIGLGAALSQSLKGDGITEVAVPVLQVAACVVAAALAGVLAAVGPARSAARVDVLRAVVTD
ncbi:MAG TPA: FtsX-like permease family protein [Mycobacteriales bacterium]|jgi:putative ABC transport system permease protein|nr:FtsX-like permease family protein [Mycobacteriales bacterium]